MTPELTIEHAARLLSHTVSPSRFKFMQRRLGPNENPSPSVVDAVNAAFADYRRVYGYQIVSNGVLRAYHGPAHVARVWTHLWRQGGSKVLAAFALYHDCIVFGSPEYTGESERISLDCAIQEVGDELDASDVVLLAEGILATAQHTRYQLGLPPFVQMMLDADLIGLADPWDQYCTSALGVRAEHPGLSSEVFNDNRRAFLEDMLSRSKIFYVEDRNYEALARDNMRRELKQLENES